MAIAVNTAHVSDFFAHLFSNLGKAANYLPILKTVTEVGALIPVGKASPEVSLIITLATMAEGVIEAHQEASDSAPAAGDSVLAPPTV
jgi:hypothetical protein